MGILHYRLKTLNYLYSYLTIPSQFSSYYPMSSDSSAYLDKLMVIQNKTLGKDSDRLL